MRRNGTFPDMCACSTMFTRRERQKCADSLVCLLQALAGQSTRLELRNEISVTGTIVSVDSCMKLAAIALLCDQNNYYNSPLFLSLLSRAVLQ